MKIYIETYGCQMNEYDSEIVTTILESRTHEITRDIEDANAILLNTCAIRENAHQRIYGRLGDLSHYKKRDKKLIIGILGCMAQNLKEELLEKRKLVDLVVGPDGYKTLPKMLEEIYGEGATKLSEISLSEKETYSDVIPKRDPNGVNAWIAIMRGCDNFCTFCVVPFTRGRERSRTVENIVEEAKYLVAQGYKQITLLGQNVNSYKDSTTNETFTDLMRAVSEIEGLKRLRFTSPHPKDFPIELLELIAEKDNICNQVQIPLQAGSNRVLEKMNRTYTKEEFLTLIENAKRIIPNVKLSTDVIVGFPTETEEEFLETLEVMEKSQFHTAYMFKYSERKGTPAERMFPDDVSAADKKSRIMRLVEQQQNIQWKLYENEIGMVHEVLIEGISERSEKDFLARTEGNLNVVFPVTEEVKIGDLVKVHIQKASSKTLFGEILPNFANIEKVEV
ncbi:MAG: tRNA (N6-isopentenyl adenosine(37)-C2)-methylthiotransferase MiaB [Calditrichaeota bacterium]|nr:MAG: tRNA (N6-isopentenyl adenosine(37)-C2)-methylthiotransferase MiaB [Calditrichota bacterium]